MARAIPPAQPPPERPDPDPDEPRHALTWRWRRNPLRRPADLAQAWIALGLFLAVLAATPVAMVLAGDAAHRHYLRTARQQAATRYEVTAVTEHDAPRHLEPGSDEAGKVRYPVTVRFTDDAGRTRTAEAEVPPSTPAGSVIRVWADTEGRVTEAPLTRDQVRDSALGCAVLAALAVPVAAAVAHRWAVRRLERRNLARWDEDWARTAPRWTVR
ncbi:Rv1733c family protein [Streptomyces nigra]|uniref:Rv1733c family protein n=1 Tax=Streptomyces nigra TaxID=1827580 RepID=UPI000D529412|nr:hypothetical protein [Streptomyces nigra]AWE54023.1 hypothetical protein DC008_32985 [Streptomyces nigra]